MEYYGSFHRANSSGYIPLGFGTASPLPNATTATAYTTAVIPVGGQSPYVVSLASSTGGNAWSVSSSGVVTGTPTLAETDTLSIRVVDSVGNSVVQPFVITVASGTAMAGAIGLNVNQLAYYNPEQPFLNLMKNASPWSISAGTGTVLQLNSVLDSDGYVMSLTPLGAGAQVNSRYGLGAGPAYGASSGAYAEANNYPPGPYTVQFSGAGTFLVQGDFTAANTPSNAYITCSGNTVTSTMPSGMTGTVQVTTVNPTTRGGFVIAISATDPSATGNYLKNIAVVLSANYASYQTGAMFNPTWIAWLQQGNLPCIRFMDFLNTNGTVNVATLASTPVAGSNTVTLGASFSATISGSIMTVPGYPVGSIQVGSTISGPGVTPGTTVVSLGTVSYTGSGTYNLSAASTVSTAVTMSASQTWTGKNGSNYTVTLANGQTISGCTATYGSSTVTLGTVVNSSAFNSYSSGYYPGGGAFSTWMIYSTIQGWADRPLVSNYSWSSNKGTPVEACVMLANQLGCDAWMNMPYGHDTAYWTSMAQLVNDGTGSSVVGFSGLNTGFTWYCELGNEHWNQGGFSSTTSFTFSAGQASIAFAALQQFPANTGTSNSNWFACCDNWFGVQTNNLGAAIKAVFGSSFAARVTVSLGAWSGNTASAVAGLAAPYWVALGGGNVAPWTTGNITAVNIAPYFGGVQDSDINTLLLSGAPFVNMFAAMTTTGTTYSSYLQNCIPKTVLQVSNHVTAVAPYGALPIIFYESGPGITAPGATTGNSYTLTGITYISATQATLQQSSGTLYGGLTTPIQQWVYISGVGGALGPQINNQYYQIAAVSGTVITINISTPALNPWTSGGVFHAGAAQFLTDMGYDAGFTAVLENFYTRCAAAGGKAPMNFYNSISPWRSAGGPNFWGTMESIEQYDPVVANEPPKWQAIVNYNA